MKMYRKIPLAHVVRYRLLTIIQMVTYIHVYTHLTFFINLEPIVNHL